MIQVNFNAATAYLLDDPWNGAAKFTVEATLPGSYERGLTGRETRRAVADTLRLDCKFTATLLSQNAITMWRNSYQALNTQPVLCPFWPARFEAGTQPVVTAAYYLLVNSDNSYSSIQAAAALPFALAAYPLMVGYLPEDIDPQMVDAYTANVEYHFVESGNLPLGFPAFNAPAGLNAAGGAGQRPLFPFTPDWSTVPAAGGAEADIEYRQIGNLRTLQSAYYNQLRRRRSKQFFTLQNNDPFNFLSFFNSMGGEQLTFWLAVCVSEANLTANVNAGDVSLAVDNGPALGTNSFILLTDVINNRIPLAVSSVVGNTWNLVGAPGVAFQSAQTRIESLVLGRFDALKLTIDFLDIGLAQATVNFKETPWETNAVANETYGITMGALPMSAIFFLFTMVTPSGTTSWYFTNFERNLQDAAGNVWVSAPLEFDTITETADLKRNTVTITSRNFANNPLSLLFPLSLEFPLMVQIFEGDIQYPNPLIGAGGEQIQGAGGEELDAVQ